MRNLEATAAFPPRIQKRADTAAGGKAVRYFIITVICAGILAAGFFFAARQHFSAMELGMKNSRLRQQIDELTAERRRLMLAREIALSPNEIKKAARGLGLRENSAVALASVAPRTAASASTQAAGGENVKVLRTVDARPTKAVYEATAAKAEEVPLARPIGLQQKGKSSEVNRLIAAR